MRGAWAKENAAQWKPEPCNWQPPLCQFKQILWCFHGNPCFEYPQHSLIIFFKEKGFSCLHFSYKTCKYFLPSTHVSFTHMGKKNCKEEKKKPTLYPPFHPCGTQDPWGGTLRVSKMQGTTVETNQQATELALKPLQSSFSCTS